MNTAMVDEVSVIIVNYNAGATLSRCVSALLDAGRIAELIIVDNASSDDSLELLRDHRQIAAANGVTMTVLPMATNLGFATACNRGAEQAGRPWLLFLNPDCFVQPDTAERLMGVLVDHPTTGLLGAMMCDADGKPQRANRRREPSPWRSLMTLTGLARWEQRWRVLQGVEHPPSDVFTDWQPVDAVSGALMLMPASLFSELGGFDEGYFLHCEDLDLCRRIREAGYTVAVAGKIDVVHLQGVSSRRTPVRVHWFKHRGMLRYTRRHNAPHQNWVMRQLIVLAISLRFFLTLPGVWLRRR